MCWQEFISYQASDQYAAWFPWQVWFYEKWIHMSDHILNNEGWVLSACSNKLQHGAESTQSEVKSKLWNSSRRLPLCTTWYNMSSEAAYVFFLNKVQAINTTLSNDYILILIRHQHIQEAYLRKSDDSPLLTLFWSPPAAKWNICLFSC